MWRGIFEEPLRCDQFCRFQDSVVYTSGRVVPTDLWRYSGVEDRRYRSVISNVQVGYFRGWQGVFGRLSTGPLRACPCPRHFLWLICVQSSAWSAFQNRVRLKPRILQAFSCFWPKIWLRHSQASHKVACFIAGCGLAQLFGWEGQVSREIFVDVSGSKQSTSCEHPESHHANGPDIYSFGVAHFWRSYVSAILEHTLHFRGHVQGCASSGVRCNVIADGSLAEAEVCNFYPPLRPSGDNQNILRESISKCRANRFQSKQTYGRLEISMHEF